MSGVTSGGKLAYHFVWFVVQVTMVPFFMR